MKDVLFGRHISQGGLDEEKEIILEEINPLEDDPIRFATILLFQNVFKKHPYGNSVFGSKETIKALTLEKVQQCYEKYFVPGNCASPSSVISLSKAWKIKSKPPSEGIKGESSAPVHSRRSRPLIRKSSSDRRWTSKTDTSWSDSWGRTTMTPTSSGPTFYRDHRAGH